MKVVTACRSMNFRIGMLATVALLGFALPGIAAADSHGQIMVDLVKGKNAPVLVPVK